jgi:hypothetical protein
MNPILNNIILLKNRRNMINRENYIAGYYVDPAVGYPVIENSNYLLFKIKVTPSTTYRMTRYDGNDLAGSGGIIRYEDINNNFIVGTNAYDKKSTSYTTPSNCVYMIFSIAKSLSKNIHQLEIGNISNPYESYV